MSTGPRRGERGPLLRDVLLLLVGMGAGAALLSVAQRLLPSALDRDVAHYLEVRRFVLDGFVEEVDADRLVRAALKGMIQSLDEYSDYYVAEEAQQVDRETSGRFTGIGVVFRGPVERGQVLFPLSGSPAEDAGLRVGDRIVAIDDRTIGEMNPEEVRARLQGEPDSVVTLSVLGLDGTERKHQVRRRSVVDPSVRHACMLDEEHGIAYMGIFSFSHQTKDEFDRTFEWLERQGMRGLVLDLRCNPGGVLGSAVEIARRFVESGPIVSTQGRSGSTRIDADPSKARWSGFPLVVLVDGRSASASEVLAGALQDHRAAVLVGSPTHGKGMVQTIHRYREEGAIAKITTSHYYTPSMRNLERDPANGRNYGIVPDLEVLLSDAEQQAVLAYAQRYGPPVERIPALEAWARLDQVEVLDEPPRDAQLDAGIALLRGERPLARHDAR